MTNKKQEITSDIEQKPNIRHDALRKVKTNAKGETHGREIKQKIKEVIVLPKESLEGKTIQELEQEVVHHKETVRQATNRLIRVLFYIYKKRDSLLESKRKPYINKKTNEFSFPAYIEKRFGYARSTACDYHSVIYMLDRHNMGNLLDSKLDLNILRRIKSIKGEEEQKLLLVNCKQLTRSNFKEKAEALLQKSPVVSKKDNRKPKPAPVAGISKLKKKYDPSGCKIILTSEDTDVLKQIDQVIDRMTPELIQDILSNRPSS